jgi:hypothetical protein
VVHKEIMALQDFMVQVLQEEKAVEAVVVTAV